MRTQITDDTIKALRSTARMATLALTLSGFLLLAERQGAQTSGGSPVGNPTLPGSHSGAAPGLMTITGGGNDIWGTFDNC